MAGSATLTAVESTAAIEEARMALISARRLVDSEKWPAAGASSVAPEAGTAISAGRGVDRQAGPEYGPSGLGFEGQAAVVTVDDDPPRGVEAEAGSPADLLGGEEGLEHPVPDLLGNAGSV